MAIDPRDIQEIKSRLDIVEVARRFVELRPSSGGRWMGPCPFHQETKGSFSVNQGLGFYYCFGCQASGDVIDFWARLNGLEFRDAVEALAQEAGVTLRQDGRREPDEAERVRRAACVDAHRVAQDFFRRQLAGDAGSAAREYLARRAVATDLAEAFGLGFAPAGWQGLAEDLRTRGAGADLGVASGLLAQGEGGRVYDRFRGRLMFPILDLAGRVIAFGGRIIDPDDKDAPKYLNSSDSPIYRKGEHLYGLAHARAQMARSRRALLTEGYMDVLSLHQFGFTDAVGVLGTALTPEQVKRLAGFCRRVDLVFDGDAPGRKAALRAAEMVLQHGLACGVVLLPGGQDVDDLLKAEGRAGFEACLAAARGGLAWACEEIAGAGSAREALDWARGFLDGLARPEWRGWYAPRLAAALGMEAGALGAASAGAQARQGAAQGAARGSAQEGHSGGQGASRGAGGVSTSDMHVLRFLGAHAEVWEDFEALGLDEALGERAREIWDAMRRRDLAGLGEAERRIVGEASAAPRLPEQLLASGRGEIFRVLALRRDAAARAALVEAIREARERGDVAEAERLAGHLTRRSAATGGAGASF